MLATLLYHGLRRTELCALHLADLQERRGVRYVRVLGKGNKISYVPLHPATAGGIVAHLERPLTGLGTPAPPQGPDFER
jgi:integrase/recombinase XerD